MGQNYENKEDLSEPDVKDVSLMEKFEDEENYSDKRKKSEDDLRLRHIFLRPPHVEPKHPIFSSPFARQISIRAFGPKKPPWYKSLNSNQLYYFKDLLNQVIIARQGYFCFNEFVENLQELDPSISRSQVLEVFDQIEEDEFEELDFGKFLFFLAFNDSGDTNEQEKISAKLSSKQITSRQSLILSAIANYVLISSVEDIERFYLQNTRRKSTVLHHHLEATKLHALSESEMELKQLKAARHLKHLFALTNSPYARPVPIVTRFTKGNVYREWKKSKYSLPFVAPEGSVSQPLIPPDIKQKLGEYDAFLEENKKLVREMNNGRLPLAKMGFPENKIMQMRKGCTTAMKDYIMEKVQQTKENLRTKRKNAAIVYAKSALIPMLHQGFPHKRNRNKFLDVYQRYLPLKEGDIKDFSFWLKPSGYETKLPIRKVHPENFAFGRKLR